MKVDSGFCRLTGEPLVEILDLGAQYVSDFVPQGQEHSVDRVSLRLGMGPTGLIQVYESYDPDKMYAKYWYRSSVNESMRQSLWGLVQDCVQFPGFKLEPGDVVMDIASNDGIMLQSPLLAECCRVGVDPSDVAGNSDLYTSDQLKAGASTLVNNYFSADNVRPVLGSRLAKLITIVAMFYDINEPVEFLTQVKDVLDPDGLLCIQLSYTPLMYEQLAFDNVCLAKGQLVTTIDGNKPIEDIQIGDKVLTDKGRFKPVLTKYVSDAPETLISLRAYGSGHDLVCTKNHPILTKRNDKWIYVAAEEIVLNDIVAKPIVQEAPVYDGDLLVNDNIAKIAGYYLAEGSFSKHKDGGVCVTFYFNSNELHTHIAELVEALKAEGFSANLHTAPGTSVTSVTTYGVIAKWLFNHFGHHALHKTIPLWFLSLDNNLLSSFLTSYINGDGYDYRNVYLRASTVGKNIAYGISLIANKLGYTCSITKCKKSPKGVILGREVNIHDLWDILIHTQPSTKNGKVWIEDNKQCMRIRKIEYIDSLSPFVYNLEVEDDNTYVTPGMTTHNCHEHVMYYTLQTLTQVLNKAGLELVDCEINDVNAGSLRVYCTHKENERTSVPLHTKYVERMRMNSLFQLEASLGVNHPSSWTNFAEGVRNMGETVVEFLTQAKADGKLVLGYGASTKGNTILQTWGIGPELLPAIADRSEPKWGTVCAGSGVPVISEDEMRAQKPDFLLIFPYTFATMFLNRERDLIEQGTKFIVPVPRLQVLGE